MSLICWDKVREIKLLGPKLVQQRMDKVKLTDKVNKSNGDTFPIYIGECLSLMGYERESFIFLVDVCFRIKFHQSNWYIHHFLI